MDDKPIEQNDGGNSKQDIDLPGKGGKLKNKFEIRMKCEGQTFLQNIYIPKTMIII